MAKQLAYTDAFGNSYPASYWVCSLVDITKDNVATINFIVYKDQTAKSNGKQPILQIQYQLADVAFTTYFANSVLNTMNPFKAAYLAVSDVTITNFFVGALDV